MRFPFTAVTVLILLGTSVSSFGTGASAKHYNANSRSPCTTFLNRRVPFSPRGGSSGSKQSVGLPASVESTETTQQQVVSAENLNILSEQGREAVLRLVQEDPDGHQKHVYGDWPEAGAEDEGKKRLADQVRNMKTNQESSMYCTWDFSICVAYRLAEYIASRFGQLLSGRPQKLPFQSSGAAGGERKWSESIHGLRSSCPRGRNFEL